MQGNGSFPANAPVSDSLIRTAIQLISMMISENRPHLELHVIFRDSDGEAAYVVEVYQFPESQGDQKH